MQASTAKNETRLPRAILRRSAAIEARIAAREPKTDPADPNAPPAPPSAEAANPADPGPVLTLPPADPRENDPAYWKQRFNVTAGVLRTEREARQADVTEFNRRLTEMQDQIRTLQASAPLAEVDLSGFLTPEQISALGEEDAKTIVETALKASRAEVQKLLDAEIKPLKEQRANDEARGRENAKQAFVDRLTELVPDWREVDVTEGFLEWLPQDDEATGLPRQALLDVSIRKASADGAARVFLAYKKTLARPSPPVAPNGSGAGPNGDIPPTNAAGLRPPTDAEVRDYYKRTSLGKVKDQERVQFEARLKLRAGR